MDSRQLSQDFDGMTLEDIIAWRAEFHSGPSPPTYVPTRLEIEQAKQELREQRLRKLQQQPPPMHKRPLQLSPRCEPVPVILKRWSGL